MRRAAQRKATRDGGVKAVHGSGNVYADLALPNPEDRLARARLVDAIREVTAKRALTRKRTNEITGVPQPKLSALLRGETRGFSRERLMRMLNVLGRDVEIRVHPLDIEHAPDGRKSMPRCKNGLPI